MSTIAYRDGVIAGDSIMTWCDQLSDGIEKVGRTENYLFGYAGRYNFMRPIYEWVAHLDKQGVHPEDFYKHQDEMPDLPDGGSAGNAIIVNRDGEIFMVSFDGFAGRIFRDYDAVGSGSDYAIGALLHGASAEEAVSLASVVDAHSGGRIHAWTFDNPVHCPNKKSA